MKTIETINTLPKPESTELLHPLDGVVSDSAERCTVLQLQTGLFELGRKRALAGGATKPIAEDQQNLADHARAIAGRTYQDSFDPSKHAHDKVRDDEYRNQVGGRNELQQGAAHARANLRDAETALAKTPKAGARPVPNPWLVAAAIIAINLSVSPTLHDRFFSTLSDDLLVWFLSIISAGFVAALLTLAILAGRHGRIRRVGLLAGIGIGIALAAIRLSTAENVSECTFAAGLTVFEIAAVLLLEWVARSLSEAENTWGETKKLEDQASHLHEAAKSDLGCWTSRLEDVNKAVRDHLAYVEERSTRNLQVSELESVAVKSALDGYNAGIGENVGRILGVRRPQ